MRQKPLFGNVKYEYLISNDEIEKVGYEVRKGLEDFYKQRKAQGLGGRAMLNVNNTVDAQTGFPVQN